MQVETQRPLPVTGTRCWSMSIDAIAPMLTLPNDGLRDQTREQEIRRIEARNRRAFKVFMAAGALLGLVVILAMLLGRRL